MCDFYENNYDDYNNQTFYIDATPILLPLLKFVETNSRIIDLGCGSGRDLLWFRQHGFSNLLGIEKSVGLAELARRQSQCEIINMDFKAIDLSEYNADLILSIASLVHVPYNELLQVVEHVSLGCKSSGYLFITLKEGSGVYYSEDGRVNYLWHQEHLAELFAKKYIVQFFPKIASIINCSDQWISLLLQKN